MVRRSKRLSERPGPRVRPLKPLTFLVDRCLGRRAVPELMRTRLLAEEQLFHLDDFYPQDVKDDLWIPEVGAKGWVILTKDARIQYRPNEQAALLAATTAVFVYTNGNTTSERTAQAMVTALPSIREAVRRCDVPMLGRVNQSGAVTVAVEEGQRLESPRLIQRKG